MERDRLEAYVDAAAAALALPLRPEHRPGVLEYFELAAGMAELVNAQSFRHDDDPAPVFVPVDPLAAPLRERKRLPR
jgi:hypothetical protein